MARRILPHSVFLLTTLLLLSHCRPPEKKPVEFHNPVEQPGASPTTPAAAPSGEPADLSDPAFPSQPGQSSASNRNDASEIRFVSYNLYNYLTQMVDGHLRSKPEEEIQAVVEVIVALDPDILGFCEIGTEQDLIDLQQRLAAAGLDLPHRTWTTGEDGTRNLGLLSAFPFASIQHPTDLRYELRHDDGHTELVGLERGIIDATIQVTPQYQLRCLGVHLKSKREVSGLNQELIRRSEAQLLRQHAEKILAQAPAINLLVYGDLNDTIHTPAIEIVRGDRSREALQLEILTLEDARGERWTHYWNWQDTYSRFDYIFVNQGLMPEIVKSKSGIPELIHLRTASDHRPIFTTIRADER